MKLSVIVVNFNVKYFLEVCLHSVLKAGAGINMEVIVTDNNSSDGSCAFVREKFPGILLIENNDNKGFSKANNQAVAIAKGEYILFLNPDTVMPEDFLVKTLSYMDEHPRAGALGPRLIDGKGLFAPDGKKSFPTLSVAIYKTTGINKLFSKSPYFNKYYAVHIGERETAPVEVLSGCCMLVRRKAMDEAGGPFDEDYFMYCEDVDLSYRITKAGYDNIYFPEVDLIHYKGESTRKMTLSYVRIFNEALVTFVKKHYSAKDARLFVFFINAGIVLRAVLGTLKRAMKILHMPLLDTMILLATLFLIKDFWVVHVKNILPINNEAVYATFPIYIFLWITSLFLSSAYDVPYRGLKVTRGMLWGTLAILAYYGLLPPQYRFSRAIIMFSAAGGTAAMLAIHELLYRLGILKFVPYDQLPKKAVVVANENEFIQTASVLEKVHYAPEIAGRIAPAEQPGTALAGLPEMKDFLFTTGINEVIFSINGLSYREVFRQMQYCGPEYEYKIHLPGSQSFIGSNSSASSGDLYTIDKSFRINTFAQQRNKRMLDIASALLLFFFLPLAVLVIRQPGNLIANIFRVLSGRRTWIGYAHGIPIDKLPKLKEGILPPYNIKEGYTPSAPVKNKINFTYAQHYDPSADIALLLKNFKFMGASQTF